MTDQLKRHLSDTVAWLTTTSPTGRPSPRPVWFVLDGEDFLVFSEAGKAKLKHIETNPRVALHFNSAPDGQDVLVISGRAEQTDSALVPSTAPGYLDKYERHYARIGFDRDRFDRSYSVGIRITPVRSWGF
ncbi:PPOX class probable F420-dependent enzyme [Actinocrispum wychmicini]|uniref:PPOX class probable F420-dependent enzyme n=2 Tax=Actinocrispum wychmicini TaxID=1213861 RepID=A0A4R2IYP8_9PSEU|nr:TIGR03667 family PPOX class F420-dependent oxidoreductase [Actinocrispum wychmicini]TCO50664.1 PPOX class probable F420-dependent enzyme [Actinocrispum wychmicini]